MKANPLAAVFRWAFALIIALFTVFTALLAADPVRAQTLQCAALDQIVAHLTERYQEQLVGDGVGPNGTRLQVYAHPEGTTWTVIGLLPDGRACFIASGDDWTGHEFTPAGSET